MQSQIEEQRQAISRQRQELEEVRRENLTRTSSQLRSSGLTERGQRQAVAGKISKAGGELTGAEIEFETEVSRVAPEYGRESYVDAEYQKAKKTLDEKVAKENEEINRLQDKIKSYEDKISKARDRKERDRYRDKIEDVKEDIGEVRAKISGYSKSYGDKATTIKNVTTGYADQLAKYEERVAKQDNKQDSQFQELKKKPEFKAQLTTLGLADKRNLSLYEYNKGVKDYNQNTAYLKQLGKYSEKVGIDNIPFARAAFGIPKDIEGEKLVIGYENSMPVVRGVESNAFQQSFSLENYNKRIEEYNKSIKQNTQPFSTMVTLTSTGLKSQKIEPKLKEVKINDYIIAPKKNMFGEIRQKVSNVFTDKFRITPREVGENVKQIGKDTAVGASIGFEYIKTIKDIGAVPVEISSKYSGGSFSPVSTVKSVGGFLKEATVSRIESEKSIKEIDKLNTDYRMGRIGNEAYTERYNKLVKNPYLSSISSNEAINLYGTEKQKGASQFIQKSIGIGGYFVPYLGTAYLAEDVYGGTKKIKQGDYLGGGFQTAVGVGGLAFKVFSAFKPVKPLSQLVKPTPMTTAGKIWAGAKITAGVGLVGYTGYSTYKETGSIGATVGAVAGTVAVPLLVGGISRQISSRIRRPEYFGKSEREMTRFLNKDLEIRNVLAEQARQSQSSWRKQLRTLGRLDKAVAAQQERYGVKIPVKSAESSMIKLGKIKEGGRGMQEIAKRRISGIVGEEPENLGLKTKEARVLFQDVTTSKRPKLESLSKANMQDTIKELSRGKVKFSGSEKFFNTLYGDKIENVLNSRKQMTQASNKLKSLFPDLFSKVKIRKIQATIGVGTGGTGVVPMTKDPQLLKELGAEFKNLGGKKGGLFYSLSTEVNLQTGKETSIKLAKISMTRNKAIIETIEKARFSTVKKGGFLIDKMPEARIVDTQVVKFTAPKTLGKGTLSSGETIELREYKSLSGVTTRKPIKLSQEQFEAFIKRKTPLSVVKDEGRFYTVKDKTYEIIKYARKEGQQDIIIEGTFDGGVTSRTEVQTIFRRFIVKGTGTSDYLNPSRTRYVEPKIKLPTSKFESFEWLKDTKPIKNIGGQNIKLGKVSSEPTTKLSQVIGQAIDKPIPMVKTDLSKSISMTRTLPQSEFYGTGTYETTGFSLPVAGALSMNLQTQLKEQIITKQMTMVQPMTMVKPMTLVQPLTMVQPMTMVKPMILVQQKIQVKQLQKVAQVLQVKQLQKLQVLQQIKTKQVTRQVIQRPTRLKTPTTIKPIKIIPPISVGLGKRKLQRLASKVDTDEFKAIAFKFGKEVEVGKGTKESVAKDLSKFLKGDLSASGFLEKGGKKLRAEETGLLKDLTFRKSRVSSYLVVEKKERRLRKGTTGKEVQFFRKARGSKL